MIICKCNRLYENMVLPIYCSCGVVHRKEEDTPITRMITLRKKICKECQHYGIARCEFIDLGCKKTYRKYLRLPGKSCPLGYWPDFS